MTPQERFQQHHALAEQDDKEAQYRVAHCYYHGHGVPKDRGKAFFWYRRAAHEKSGKAMHKLGFCYHWGVGVVADREAAEKFWRASVPLLTAEATPEGQQDTRGTAGDPESMCLLGEAYLHGYGVQQDDHQYTKWMQRSAELENPWAQFSLADAYRDGDHGLEQNLELAFYWYHKAAENGDDDVQRELGRSYRNGDGVQIDLVKALYWFQKAVDGGNRWARRELEQLQQQISAERAHWEANVKATLSSSSPLSLWALGLATLSAQHHQPSGFSPTFRVLKTLALQLSRNVLLHLNPGSKKRPNIEDLKMTALQNKRQEVNWVQAKMQ